MTLIVDGYNLLHASGVFGASRGPQGFEQSRHALLDMLVDLLGQKAGDTIVVFDAARAPDGLPGRLVHGGIRVWFAREYPDADSLIEELVEDDTAPAHLVVVSSDRRLQAAARRRRARAVSCEDWLAEAREARRARGRPSPDAKPPDPGPEGADFWKRYFGFDD
ncbi:MAG: NYN domain-containing protein [Planctomycetaceae bacterium]